MDTGKSNLLSDVWRPHISSFCFLHSEESKAPEFLIRSNIISEIKVFVLSLFYSEEHFVVPGLWQI